MTNGDKIRRNASTNEGLAKLIGKYVGCGSCPIREKCGEKRGVCKSTLERWLKEKAMKQCPFCGAEKADYTESIAGYWVECPSCGARTKTGCTLEAAMALWNRRAEDAD